MSVMITGVSFRTAKVRLLDFGGLLTPGLGGAVQRINRLGSRYALDVNLPPLRDDSAGRLLASKLLRGKEQGVIFPFPQPNLAIGFPGASPHVGSPVIGGATLPLAGLDPGYVIREGQFFSVISGGARYLYSATADTTASGVGFASVPIFPMLRTEMAGGEVVEIADPMIEGQLEGDVSYDIMLEPFFGITFSVVESA